MASWLQAILYILIGLVAGAVGGFLLSRHLFKKELQKNPPISEKQIRAMYAQMGVKPSEAKIKQIMKSMNQNR